MKFRITFHQQTYDDARSLQRRQSQDGESSRRHHHLSLSDKPGVNFINILRAAFAHADPKSVKRY